MIDIRSYIVEQFKVFREKLDLRYPKQAELSDVATSGSYNDLSDKPTIPTVSTTTPQMDGTAAVGSSSAYARADHRHPKDTSLVTLATGQTITGNKKFQNSTLEIDGGEFKFHYHLERRLRGISANGSYANWDSEKKDGTWHRIWRVSFPEGSNFWGKLTIGFVGSYSSFNASGYIEKEICVAFNGSTLYNNVGRYSALGLNVEKDFRISELVWNSDTNQWQILIYSHQPSGNNYPQEVIIKCETTNNTVSITAFEGITVSNAEISQIASYVNSKATVDGTSKTFYFADLPVYQDPYGEEIAVISDIPTKVSQLSNDSGFLTSHQQLKTINGESIVGSGNITIQGGGSGDVNVIEVVKVNGTALTPDANKAVDITVPAAITESTVSGWGFTKNTGTVSSLSDLGITATATELNYVDGVTSNIQTQLNAKGTYSKPGGGIPKTDLASAVQTSLGKADTALQSAPVTSVNGQTGAVTLTIPSAVTESTVAGWGFTKNTGTYSKPSGGIPASDLAAGVIPTVPTNVSAFTNDAGYITNASVVTIYSGSSAPSSSLGNNGDIYIQTS